MHEKKPTKSARKKRKGPTRKKFRRAFIFQTDEFQLNLIRHGGKIRALRLPKRYLGDIEEREARRNYARYMIFHLLFPQHALEPVSIASVKKRGKERWGMVTEIIKGRSRDYKIFQRCSYMEGYEPSDVEIDAIGRHEKFVVKNGRKIKEDIWKKTGISLNYSPVNVCNVKGKPVFFEVDKVDPKKVWEYAEKKLDFNVPKDPMKFYENKEKLRKIKELLKDL
ncbi:MAG: hypothetical protein ABID38_06990 [Candidatus Diapherotrites archaeon]